MDEEELGKLLGSDMNIGQDEDSLLGGPVNDDQDGVEAVRFRKLLDEVHGVGVPQMIRNGERLEEAIRPMTGSLITGASVAGADILFNVVTELRPGVVTSDNGQGAVLTKMTRENVVVTISEYTEPEITRLGDPDATVVEEETGIVDGPERVCTGIG